MVYRFKTGARLGVPAQVAGEECARLESEGRLTPHELVEESRPEDAPLHGEFEWDDRVAAERYRDGQAGYIIRSVEVVLEGTAEPTRSFVSLTPAAGAASPYVSIRRVLAHEDKRARLMERALMELSAFQRKYSQLSELAGVFAAIDAIRAEGGA